MKRQEIHTNNEEEISISAYVERAINLLPSFFIEAEKIFISGFNNGNYLTNEKTVRDFTTEIDQKIEELFSQWVKENFPDAALFGEENGWQLGSDKADWLWAIDPVDGTTNFMNKNPECSIVISLRYKQEPVLAICDLPIKSENYTAIKNKGVFLNGSPANSPTTLNQLNKSLLISTFLTRYERMEQMLGNLWNEVGGVIMKMSSLSEVCDIVTGKASLGVFYGLGAYEWPAAYLFAKESGCIIRTLENKDTEFNFKGLENKNILIVANKSLFNQVKNHLGVPEKLSS